MNETGQRHEADWEKQIHLLAAGSEPSQTEFADRIMRRIEAGSRDLTDEAGERLSRRSPALPAVILACVLLLSGFTYAASVGDWLTVRDEAGRIAMEIRHNPSKEPAGYGRIRSELRERLKPGETAAFVIGEEAVAGVKRGETPRVVYEVSGSHLFASWEEASRHLPEPLARIRMPAEVGGLKLGRVELSSGPSASEVLHRLPQKPQWKEMTEPETGTDYAFLLLPARNGIRHAVAFYGDANTGVAVAAAFAQERSVQVIYDDLPSSSRVARIGNIPVYKGDPHGLVWSEHTGDGLLSFHALSGSGDADRELAAARALIAPDAADR